MSTETNLVVAGVVIPLGAGRGIQCRVERIGAGAIRRDVNGVLHDLTREKHRKFRVSVDCRDQAAPAFDGVWAGAEVVVDLPKRLRASASGGAAELSRDPVPGSVRAYAADGSVVSVSVNGRTVSAPGAAHVEFRPRLTMLVVEISEDGDEWTADEGWSLILEEV